MEIRRILPGVLVSLKTRTRGNVSYTKWDLERPHPTESGAEVSTWQTRKYVYDPAEAKEASQVANRARYLVSRVCVTTELDHLLCPAERRDELKDAIDEAKELVAEFNARASYTEVDISVVLGEVTDDAVNVAQTIMADTQKFMEQMQQGLRELDPKKIKAAIDKSRKLGQMMAPRDNLMVLQAAAAAEEARKRIIDAGEQVVVAIDAETIARIGTIRNSFLDFDTVDEVYPEATPITPRVIDFTDDYIDVEAI